MKHGIGSRSEVEEFRDSRKSVFDWMVERICDNCERFLVFPRAYCLINLFPKIFGGKIYLLLEKIFALGGKDSRFDFLIFLSAFKGPASKDMIMVRRA